MTADFVFKDGIAGSVLNEGDYHGVVVVGNRKSLAAQLVVRAVKCATLTKQYSAYTATF